MKYKDLYDLVEDYHYDPRRSEVRFGCDCGCGGDYYTYEDWVAVCDAADEAKRKLIEFGVEFDD